MAKKSFASFDKKIYLPLILRAAFLKVISTPTLLFTYFFLVVIKDSNDILYIVRSSIYPLVSFLIKSFGKSITNLLSHSLRYKSEGFEPNFE